MMMITVIILLGLLTVLFMVRRYIVSLYHVVSESMEPTLRAGDFVLVNPRAYRNMPPKKGDVVVFRSPHDGTPCVKRVTGLAGEVVTLIDGSRARVPEGNYFLTGDARDGTSRKSFDSRFFGPVARSLIRGQAVRVLASMTDKSRNNLVIR